MKQNKDNLFDQYFTKPDIAKHLYEKSKEIISKYDNIDDYLWIEPSAGNGSFYDLLPDNKIGIDINSMNDNIIKMDYLQYELPDKKMIVIGNPPFGHKGVMALEFIHHSYKADYVCFILPMFFISQAKGSIKDRVLGFNLIHSEKLSNKSFYVPNSQKDVKIQCVFQIWSKHHKLDNNDWYKKYKHYEPFTDIVKVCQVSTVKTRECGKEWIDKADFYLNATFYKRNSVVDSFNEVLYKQGIAIIFTTKDFELRKRIRLVFETVDWTKYGSISTNSCYHLGKINVYNMLHDYMREYEMPSPIEPVEIY